MSKKEKDRMTGFYVKLNLFPKKKSYLSIQIFLKFLIIRDIIIHQYV